MLLPFITLLFVLQVLASTEVSFRDANIEYIGRWHRGKDTIASDWPGAYFKVTLKQTRSIKLQLTQPTSFQVSINNNLFEFHNATSTVDLVPPQGLENDGPHQLIVTAMNVDRDVSLSFSSITVDDAGQTVSPNANYPMVEYVGHDLTLGVDTSRSFFTSFAWLTSDLLGLERSLVAYRQAKLVGGIQNKYFQHVDGQRVPWSVVVLLGANDHAVDYTSHEYKDVLTSFITKIRKTLYESAPIFILCEPLGDMFRSSQQAVLDLVRSGDQHVYFIDTTAWLRYGSSNYKDSGHLTDAGHALFANKLAPLLQIKLTHPRDPLPGPPPNPNLPGDWQTMDVGQEDRIGLPGTVSADSSTTFTLWGSGADIDNDRDAFRFVYQPFSDQGVIEGAVQSHSAFAKCAKAGIMIREHLGNGSPLIMLGISPAEGIFVQVRYNNYESTKVFKKMRASPPYRLRLVRQKSSDVFDAQIQHIESTNDTWETFASIPFVMARDVYAGLAVTSCDTSVVSVAKFTEVAIYHSAFMNTKEQQPRFIEQQQQQ